MRSVLRLETGWSTGEVRGGFVTKAVIRWMMHAGSYCLWLAGRGVSNTVLQARVATSIYNHAMNCTTEKPVRFRRTLALGLTTTRRLFPRDYFGPTMKLTAYLHPVSILRREYVNKRRSHSGRRTISISDVDKIQLPNSRNRVMTLYNHYTLYGRDKGKVVYYINIKKKLHGLSPRANYTDRATVACRRSDCQL
jgi:hypothetical protein